LDINDLHVAQMHTAIFNSSVFDCHVLKGSVGQFLCINCEIVFTLELN